MQPAIQDHSFHWADYLLFALTIAASLAIGVYYAVIGKMQETAKEYLIANKQLSLFPTSLSLLASFLSGFGMLGFASEIYLYGSTFLWSLLGAALGYLIGAATFVPLFYPLDLISVHEYLRMRFKSMAARRVGSFLNIATAIVVMGVGLMAPAVALEAVIGFPYWASMLITAFVATLYTVIGGMKAVVWSDALQVLIIFIGLLAVVIKGLIDLGGFDNMWTVLEKWERADVMNFDTDPTQRLSFWSVTVGIGVQFLAYTVVQPSVMRYVSMPSLPKAELSLLLNIPYFFIMNGLLLLSGMLAFAYYAGMGCDPLRVKILRNPNMILPYFVMDMLNVPGVVGIFIAALFAAALSTLSTQYNGIATTLYVDFLAYIPGVDRWPAFAKGLLNKVVVVLLSVVGLGFGVLFNEIGGTFIKISMSLISAFKGPLLGMYILAAAWPRANGRAAIVGVLVAAIFTSWLAIGPLVNKIKDKPPMSPIHNCSVAQTQADYNMSTMTTWEMTSPVAAVQTSELDFTTAAAKAGNELTPGLKTFYSISYLYYQIISTLIVIIVGMLLSIIPWFAMDEPVPRKYLFHFIRPCCGPCTTTEDDEALERPGFDDDEDEMSYKNGKAEMNGKENAAYIKDATYM